MLFPESAGLAVPPTGEAESPSYRWRYSISIRTGPAAYPAAKRAARPRRDGRRQLSEAGQQLRAIERNVGEELAVPARTPPGWAPRRFGEQRVDQAEIEAIEDGSMVEQRAPQAALGVAGELAVSEGEVGAL